MKSLFRHSKWRFYYLITASLFLFVHGVGLDGNASVEEIIMRTTNVERFDLTGLATAPPDANIAGDLELVVDYEDRPYLVGEPVWIRASLVNRSGDPILVVLGGEYGGKNHIYLNVQDLDGQSVPPGPLPKRRTVPTSREIPSGHQWIQVFNVPHYHRLVEPGDYAVTAHFVSDGQYVDQPTRQARQDGWSGEMEMDVGNIKIRQPERLEDQAALRSMIELGRVGTPPQHFTGVFTKESVRHALIQDHPNSRYTSYARYYSAETVLRGGSSPWKLDQGRGRQALDLLAPIDRQQYPKLFQEMVLHRLILAHVGAGSDAATLRPLVEEFRQEFPDSPYELPDAARQAAP